MPRKPKNPINVAQRVETPAYSTWNTDDERTVAIQNLSKSVDEFRSIARTRDFSGLAPGVSGRPGLGRSDYDYFRPDEATPKNYKDIIFRVDMAYQKVGLIKNIIDLMGDFTGQGLRICHPNRNKEKLLNDWYQKVNGPRVTERFCNLLYRHGTVIIESYTTKIRSEDEIKAMAAPDMLGFPKPESFEKKELPAHYVFHNPATVEIVGGALASFSNKPLYGYKLSEKLRKQIKDPRTDRERELVARLPEKVKRAAETNDYVLLPENKTSVYHYKTDDWCGHPYPLIYSILDDIALLEKMKLADLCALDGAVSKIRVFKLGDIENKIAPNPAAFAKLSELLENNVGGGTIDLVWSADLKIEETKNDSFNYLGEDKYKSVLNSIYAALGIPPTLTGTFGAAGTTNNFISLKTLTERLEYGRSILVQFWMAQLALVQKALGIRLAAQIEFDKPILANEDMEKKLLMDMVDRNIISEELVRRRLGANDNMENIRLKREDRQRKADRRVRKTGPFFNAFPEDELKKIALQGGQATPSQVGLELEAPKNGEKKQMDMNFELQKEANKQKNLADGPKKMKGIPGQGRPKMSKDKQKRKIKTVRPRTKGTITFWAKDAQAKISELLNPILLAHYNKKNMRSLTDAQWKEAETIKFGVLCNIEPFSTIDEETIKEALNLPLPAYAKEALDVAILDFTENLKNNPTIDEIREMQCSIFTDLYSGEDND
jgi:hypothetical protein